MKSKVLSFIAIVPALFCSCNAERSVRFEGNYSFKTSGAIYARQTAEPADTLLPAEITIKLATESGQMDITPDGGGNGGMIVTMNVTGGDILVYEATAGDGTLVLVPDTRRVSFSYPSGVEPSRVSPSFEAEIVISGEAHRYDNIVLFSFAYGGTFEIGDTGYEIYDSDIDCRAKLNE